MDEFIALSTGMFSLYYLKVTQIVTQMMQLTLLTTLDESFLSNNSSLSGDRNSDAAYLRFAELEKKIADQGDEIVCLKSTLADVLRRLTQLEGRGKENCVNITDSNRTL